MGVGGRGPSSLQLCKLGRHLALDLPVGGEAGARRRFSTQQGVVAYTTAASVPAHGNAASAGTVLSHLAQPLRTGSRLAASTLCQGRHVFTRGP